LVELSAHGFYGQSAFSEFHGFLTLINYKFYPDSKVRLYAPKTEYACPVANLVDPEVPAATAQFLAKKFSKSSNI